MYTEQTTAIMYAYIRSVQTRTKKNKNQRGNYCAH